MGFGNKQSESLDGLIVRSATDLALTRLNLGGDVQLCPQP